MDIVVFVLDNYDSFTYNLVQYLGELGAKVEVRRNDEVTVSEIEAMHPERIVLSPGPCTPQEAGISIELIRHFAGKVPLLGVCLGHQAIGAAFGGQVVRAKTLMHGKTSQVEHDGKTIFRGLTSPMTATRYHSLIVAEDSLPGDLAVSAWTRDCDGTRVIMGLRHKNFAVEGSAVSSRERADGRREETGGKFPAELIPLIGQCVKRRCYGNNDNIPRGVTAQVRRDWRTFSPGLTFLALT